MIKKRILLLTPTPSHPQTAGNRARIYSLADAIRQLGHELHFAHVEREKGDVEAMAECWGKDCFFPLPYANPNSFWLRVRRKMRSLIWRDSQYVLPIDAWYDHNTDNRLKTLYRQYRYDIVLVEYAFFSKAFTCFPGHVAKILDTHDVLTDRHRRYLENNGCYNWFSTTASQEKKGLSRADVVIAIQDREREFFSRLTGKRVVTIGHTVKIKQCDAVTRSKGAMLFIGSANHSNIDAIKFFMEDMFPIIRASLPDAVLLIAGPICRVLDHVGDGVTKLGEPDDLDPVYDMAGIVINPIRYGTGLKIKNIEALGYSKPLVTTSVGAEGLEKGIGSAFLTADTANDFIDAIIKIAMEPSLYQNLSMGAYDFSVAWNERQKESLESIL